MRFYVSTNKYEGIGYFEIVTKLFHTFEANTS